MYIWPVHSAGQLRCPKPSLHFNFGTFPPPYRNSSFPSGFPLNHLKRVPPEKAHSHFGKKLTPILGGVVQRGAGPKAPYGFLRNAKEQSLSTTFPPFTSTLLLLRWRLASAELRALGARLLRPEVATLNRACTALARPKWRPGPGARFAPRESGASASNAGTLCQLPKANRPFCLLAFPFGSL